MIQANYITNLKGRKIAVQIPIKYYEKLISDSEELEDIKEYRNAKTYQSEPIPFAQAFREIEESYK